MMYSLHGFRSLRFALAVVLCAAGHVAAQDRSLQSIERASTERASSSTATLSAEKTSPKPPLQYRRVLVPQDALDQFTAGHIPMLRDQLPEMVEAIERRERESQDDAAWIESAEYTAIFADGHLTAGLAQLHVVHTASEPSILLLSPCQLALGAATWQRSDAVEDALLGNDLEGNLLAQVSSSGQLRFPWTLRGTTNDWGEAGFDVVLAPAPLNQLTLELPDDYQLFSSRGIVSLVTDERDDRRDPLGNTKRWRVQLGGRHAFRLTVASNEAVRQRQQQVGLQQDTIYRLAADGLEVECSVELEIQKEPLETLLFRVDTDLQVTSIRLGNRQVTWSLTSEPGSRSRLLQVRFAEPLSGIHRTLQLSAFGELKTDVMWHLPQFHPQDTFWRQGTMTLVVPDALGLRHLIPHDAQQSAATRTATESQTTRQFELFSSDSSLEINVVRALHRPTADVGTTIDLEPGAITAQIIAALSCNAGQHFLLEAVVPNTWTLDEIESEPASALKDHLFVAYEAGRKRLQIRLAEPLTHESPVLLTIRAHRTPTLELRAQDFRPLRFSNLAHAERLVAVVPDPSLRLELSGDIGVERQDPDDLPPSQTTLLRPRNGGLVFRDTQQADTMSIRTVTREDQTYTAQNYVHVEITDSTLTESYRLVCKPDASSVNRLRIQLSQSRDALVQWSLMANGNRLLSATRLSDASAGLPKGSANSETWELVLRSRQQKPFEVLGVRKTAFQTAEPISLATMPQATSQEGWLSIVSLDGTTLSIKANSVKPIPTVPREPQQCSVTRARYRYDVSPSTLVLVDRIVPRAVQAPLWAWHCQLQTQLFNGGQLTHRATYLLESAGGSVFHFRLPPNCTLRSVELDGTTDTRPEQTETTRSYSVTLPADVRYPRLSVSYSAPAHDYRLVGHVTTRLPAVDIPVLDQAWTLWLAPGLAPLSRPTNTWHQRPASWTQRLLGPLAAPPDEPPFQMFSAEHWSSLAHSSNSIASPNRYAQWFLQMLGEQYLQLKTQSPPSDVTWQALMSGVELRVAGAGVAPQIWIDSSGLAEAGFVLERQIEAVDLFSPVPVGSELLTRENLAVVAHGEIVMLTSLDGLAKVPSSVRPTSVPAVADVLSSSPLASELESLAKWPVDAILPLTAWTAQPAVASAPWALGPRVAHRGIASGPWQARQITLEPDGHGSMSVVRLRMLNALGIAALLAVAGFVSWIGSRRSRALLPLVVAAAFVAMLVPDLWIPLTANVFLGSLLGCLILGTRRLLAAPEPPGETAPSQDPVPSSTAVATGLVLVAVLLTWPVRSLLADDLPAAKASDARQDISQLIVPVDKDMNPVGDYDYLPGALYDLLHLRAEGSQAASQHWLIHRGTFHAVFNWTRQRSSLDLTSLTATYQLELLQPLQRIAFPWQADDPTVQILEARLAGQPIELNWNDDRTAFFITVPNAGVTQLEFVLLPTITTNSGTRHLQFGIPPMSRSQLRIETPFDAPDIDVDSAAGEAAIVPETGERLVELGPVRSLALRWADGAERWPTSRRLDVQQLNWIKVRPKDYPDSVILDAKWRIQSPATPVEQILLRTDRRLRLLPVADEENVEVDESGLRSDDQAPVVVRFRQPTDRDTTLHLQFLVVNATGLGNLSLPRIDVIDARVERKWLAISVGSDLDFSAGISDALAPMEAAEFLTAWGEAELAPNLCYRVVAEDSMWNIGTRLRYPRAQADQQLDISVGHTEMELVLKADIETQSGVTFQHNLSVPQGFKVTDVRVSVDEQDVPAQAEHDGSGSLTLLLDQGVTGLQHLELRGTVKVTAIDSEFPVPQVTLQNAAVTGSTVRIYRQVNVLVGVLNATPSGPAQRVALGRYREGFGRLVAVLDLNEDPTDEQTTPAIVVRPNRPTVRGQLITTLLRRNDTWEAIADYSMQVGQASAGVVDQFRFELPEEWSELSSVEPPMPYEIRSIPGDRRLLVLRPVEEAATNRFQLRIRGTLTLGANERGRTPHIVPLDVRRLESFFVLPTQLDQQRIDWETSGLSQVDPRDAIPNSRVDPRAYVTYAVRSNPRAVIADVRRVAGERQIGLADVHVRCQKDGTCFGTVAFDIEPAELTSCTLEIPSACELIQATIEGVPATLTPLADRRWQVRLASEQLPQQLTVLFRTRLPSKLSSKAQTIQVPSITDADLQVVRTLWTIHGPRTLELAGDSLSQHRVSAAAQESVRLRTTASLIESSVETVLDSPATESEAWYAPWAVRLACSDARLAREQHRGGVQSPMSPDAVAALHREQEIIVQRMNASPDLDAFRRLSAQYPQPSDMLRFAHSDDTVTRHYAFIDKPPEMSVTFSDSRLSAWWTRVLGALLVMAAGGLTWLGSRNKRVIDWLSQWPYAIGVLVGLGWWLLASPSWLGWIVIAVSLWGALRLPIPSRAAREVVSETPTETAS